MSPLLEHLSAALGQGQSWSITQYLPKLRLLASGSEKQREKKPSGAYAEWPKTAITAELRLLPSETGLFSIFCSLRKLSFASRQSFQNRFGRGYVPSLMSCGLWGLP